MAASGIVGLAALIAARLTSSVSGKGAAGHAHAGDHGARALVDGNGDVDDAALLRDLRLADSAARWCSSR